MHDHAVYPKHLAMALVNPFGPTLNLRVFMCGIIVDNQVKRQTGGGFLFKMLDEPEPFLVSVALHCLADDFPIQIIKGREESDGSVPDVVMRAGSHSMRPQW